MVDINGAKRDVEDSIFLYKFLRNGVVMRCEATGMALRTKVLSSHDGESALSIRFYDLNSMIDRGSEIFNPVANHILFDIEQIEPSLTTYGATWEHQLDLYDALDEQREYMQAFEQEFCL